MVASRMGLEVVRLDVDGVWLDDRVDKVLRTLQSDGLSAVTSRLLLVQDGNLVKHPERWIRLAPSAEPSSLKPSIVKPSAVKLVLELTEVPQHFQAHMKNGDVVCVRFPPLSPQCDATVTAAFGRLPTGVVDSSLNAFDEATAMIRRGQLTMDDPLTPYVLQEQ
jgi:hypothetical protein